jgi:hypothetical protein
MPDSEITLLVTTLGVYVGNNPQYKKLERLLNIKLRRSPWNPGFG